MRGQYPIRQLRVDAAALHGVGKRGEGIGGGGDEFLGEEAVEAGLGDRPDDGRVVEFLGLVDFVAAGTPAVWKCEMKSMLLRIVAMTSPSMTCM